MTSSFWYLWRSSKSVNEPKAGGGWILNMKQRHKCKTLIVLNFHKENENPNIIICITMPMFLEIIKILELKFPWRVWTYRITRMSIICKRNLHTKNETKMPFASNERLVNCDQSGNGNVIMLPFLKKLHKGKQGKGLKSLKQQLQYSWPWYELEFPGKIV